MAPSDLPPSSSQSRDEVIAQPVKSTRTRSPTLTAHNSSLVGPGRPKSFRVPVGPASAARAQSIRAPKVSSDSGDAATRVTSTDGNGRPPFLNKPEASQRRSDPSKSHQRSRSLFLPPSASSPAVKSSQTTKTPDTKRIASSLSQPNSSRLNRTTSTSASGPPLSTRRTVREPSSSIAAHSKPATPSKQPAFSTYQQDFHKSGTPTRNRTTAQILRNTSDTASASSPTHEQDGLRAQVHLLHLSLLHDQANSTLKALTASARSSFATRHASLQALYTEVLTLRRSARQSRNLLALHTWCGGNVAALTRKLNILTGVLADITALSEPENGRYARVVQGFEAWVAWVTETWAERDAQNIDEESGDMHDSVDQNSDRPAQGITPIAGLGDGMKAEIKALLNLANTMASRLEELQRSAMPGFDDSRKSESATPPNTLPAPAVLLSHASSFVDGMQEELQMMREMDFEVEVGEKMWMEERVRRLQADIDGGW